MNAITTCNSMRGISNIHYSFGKFTPNVSALDFVIIFKWSMTVTLQQNQGIIMVGEWDHCLYIKQNQGIITDHCLFIKQNQLIIMVGVWDHCLFIKQNQGIIMVGVWNHCLFIKQNQWIIMVGVWDHSLFIIQNQGIIMVGVWDHCLFIIQNQGIIMVGVWDHWLFINVLQFAGRLDISMHSSNTILLFARCLFALSSACNQCWHVGILMLLALYVFNRWSDCAQKCRNTSCAYSGCQINCAFLLDFC